MRSHTTWSSPWKTLLFRWYKTCWSRSSSQHCYFGDDSNEHLAHTICNCHKDVHRSRQQNSNASCFSRVASKITTSSNSNPWGVLRYINTLYTLTLHQFNFGAISVTFQAISVPFRSHFGDKTCTALAQHLHSICTALAQHFIPPTSALSDANHNKKEPKSPAFDTNFVIFDNLLALVETVVSCRRNIISCKIGPCFHTRFFVDASGMIISWLFVPETSPRPPRDPPRDPPETPRDPPRDPSETFPKPHFLEEFPSRPQGHIFPVPRSPRSQNSIDMYI